MTCDTTLEAQWSPSPNFEPRRNGLTPTLLILHYTAMDCGQKAVKWLCNPEAKVSSHYLIDEDGTIVQMVNESERAWHAGVSCWKGETDINSCSIGIEIQNLGHAVDILPEFPETQMQAVEKLCLDIITRHQIPPENILGHSDIALGRKVDPGENFDWARLYKSGIGHWVEPALAQEGNALQTGDKGDDVGEIQNLLALYGYGVKQTQCYDENTKNAVTAFQRHWRQQCVDGIADISTINTLRHLIESLRK